MLNWLQNFGFGGLGGVQQAEQGGFGGNMVKPQPAQPAQPTNRFLSDPAISNALIRMGGSILQANSQGAGFGGSLGAGAVSFADGLNQGRETQMRQMQIQAEIQKAQREGQYGIQSGGFEGDIARATVILQNPDSTPQDRMIAQGVISTAERRVGAYDPLDSTYKMRQKQQIGVNAGLPSQMPAGAPMVQEEALPPMNLPLELSRPSNGMLMPPAATKAEMGNRGGAALPLLDVIGMPSQTKPNIGFTPTGNAKIDAELQKAAAEKNMQLQAAQIEAQIKGRGESAASFESQLSKIPELEQTIKKLDTLSDKASYTYLDRGMSELRKQLGGTPTEGSIARAEYIAVVDNQVLPLLRDTFGAQFTVAEGESLRATLGDPNKSPQEKKAVLNAFIEQKRNNLVSEARRAGMDYTPQSSSQESGTNMRDMSDDEIKRMLKL